MSPHQKMEYNEATMAQHFREVVIALTADTWWMRNLNQPGIMVPTNGPSGGEAESEVRRPAWAMRKACEGNSLYTLDCCGLVVLTS